MAQEVALEMELMDGRARDPSSVSFVVILMYNITSRRWIMMYMEGTQ